MAFAALRVPFPAGAEVLDEIVFLEEMFFLAQLLAEKMLVLACGFGVLAARFWIPGRREAGAG